MSRRELDPAAVAERLAWLREHWTPEDMEAARGRMQPRARSETFAEGAFRRLNELRALCELTRRLQLTRPSAAQDARPGRLEQK